MNIAVVNDGTNLIYFEHMDGAFLGSIYISQQKAITAANFPFPTRFIGELAFGASPGKSTFTPIVVTPPGSIASGERETLQDLIVTPPAVLSIRPDVGRRPRTCRRPGPEAAPFDPS